SRFLHLLIFPFVYPLQGIRPLSVYEDDNSLTGIPVLHPFFLSQALSHAFKKKTCLLYIHKLRVIFIQKPERYRKKKKKKEKKIKGAADCSQYVFIIIIQVNIYKYTSLFFTSVY